MGTKETLEELRVLEARQEALRQRLAIEHAAEVKAQPLLERIVYAATARCDCGAGLAYDPADDEVLRGDGCWDCSTIILGTAIPSGQPGAVTHTGKLPFRFYSVKSERQPSMRGATTRPPSDNASS